MRKISLIITMLAVVGIACKHDNKGDKQKNFVEEKDAIGTNKAEELWSQLFNGENLDGWKAFNADSISSQWQVKDGVIVFTPAPGKRTSTENLITENTYTNFELSLEWKISKGGNSGIMWGVQEGEAFSEPYLTGPEIQILDNELHPDATNGPIRQAGALYDMMPPKSDKTKNAGKWNKTVIKIDHNTNKGSVRLNGFTINEFPVHGKEWKDMVKSSKFKNWENFGKTRKGHIALQDHSDKVWFRNIKIKEL
ncbi:DUF1080 domain-containing protein [Salegentibacter sp. BLCTC]|uniref:3-keto-disaccharide hydrolase n=1 Tax=Salegentibacter sp. BLCTC TaxID=2697368 RepID=UPI00187BA2F7|nr:DUF1080 domain-containing protein [Salegentibacter sp. BLCTC]MBE7640573.1 DUF1080 domain-containing protein [Salegentibacter sp. BLCTC]